MCFATAALALTAVSGGMKVIGDINEGQAVANEAKYNAQVATNNAAYSAAAGQSQAEAESLKNAQVAGRVKAAQAANGVDVNSGSAVDVQESQREAGVVDVQNIENNALLQAYGYKSQATLDKQQAKDAIQGSQFSALGDLLGTASSVSGKWSGLQKSGSGGFDDSIDATMADPVLAG